MARTTTTYNIVLKDGTTIKTTTPSEFAAEYIARDGSIKEMFTRIEHGYEAMRFYFTPASAAFAEIMEASA